MEFVTSKGMKRSQLVIVAALVFFAVTVVARFPGEMNPDSVDQYQQAVSGRYTDWHPPVMARLWAVLRVFADGPWTMYALQTAVYWLAFGIIAAALMKAERPALAWCALLTGAFPPFLMIAINVHKDVGLAAVFLLAFALIFRCRLPGRPVGAATHISVALLICYGVLVRSNGGFAAVPLIIYAWAPGLLRRPVSAVALCLFAGLALVPATGWMNIHVLNAERRAAIRSLQSFDVVGIAAHTDDPSLLQTIGLDKDQVRNCYTPIFRWGHCLLRRQVRQRLAQAGRPTRRADRRRGGNLSQSADHVGLVDRDRQPSHRVSRASISAFQFHSLFRGSGAPRRRPRRQVPEKKRAHRRDRAVAEPERAGHSSQWLLGNAGVLAGGIADHPGAWLDAKKTAGSRHEHGVAGLGAVRDDLFRRLSLHRRGDGRPISVLEHAFGGVGDSALVPLPCPGMAGARSLQARLARGFHADRRGDNCRGPRHPAGPHAPDRSVLRSGSRHAGLVRGCWMQRAFPANREKNREKLSEDPVQSLALRR